MDFKAKVIHISTKDRDDGNCRLTMLITNEDDFTLDSIMELVALLKDKNSWMVKVTTDK